MSDPHPNASALSTSDPDTLITLLPASGMRPTSNAYAWLAEQLVHQNHTIEGLYTRHGIDPVQAYHHLHTLMRHKQLGYCDTITAIATLLQSWCDNVITRDQYHQHHLTDHFTHSPISIRQCEPATQSREC